MDCPCPVYLVTVDAVVEIPVTVLHIPQVVVHPVVLREVELQIDILADTLGVPHLAVEPEVAVDVLVKQITVGDGELLVDIRTRFIPQ